MNRKSYVLAIALAFLFGPFGVMYASFAGGFLLLIIELILLIVSADIPGAPAIAISVFFITNIALSVIFVMDYNADQKRRYETERKEEEQRLVRLAEAIRNGADVKQLVQ